MNYFLEEEARGVDVQLGEEQGRVGVVEAEDRGQGLHLLEGKLAVLVAVRLKKYY